MSDTIGSVCTKAENVPDLKCACVKCEEKK